MTYISKLLRIMVKSRIYRLTDMWISVIIRIYTLAANFYRSSPIIAHLLIQSKDPARSALNHSDTTGLVLYLDSDCISIDKKDFK